MERENPEKIKIKPPLSPESNKEMAALKAELEQELKSKKLCAYPVYSCSELTLDSYNYCAKHILKDPNAPFKQCSFIYPGNGKRCPQAAPKNDKRDISYCPEHAVITNLTKSRQNAKRIAPKTAEALLCSLSHHVKKPIAGTSSAATVEDNRRGSSDDSGQLYTIDPFVDLDASKKYGTANKESAEVCSESDSDIDPVTCNLLWHDYHETSSDDESVDDADDNPLKNANVYTAEEITKIARDKLIKLQSLYIEQYRYLRYVLAEKKRKYEHSLKREKETYCAIKDQIQDNPKEQRLYQKLKAYKNYHKTHGYEAILERRARDLRAKITEGLQPKAVLITKCTFTEGEVKCGERAIPLSKFCRRHILSDPNQVLFKACGVKNNDIECPTPVEAIFEVATCRLHMELPPIRSYAQTRKSSESDFDESLDIGEEAALLSADLDMKSEFMDLPELSRMMANVPKQLFDDEKLELKEDPDCSQGDKESSDTSMRTESCEGDNKLDTFLEFNEVDEKNIKMDVDENNIKMEVD